MPTFLPDSSCIVARLSRWHPHHAAARAELDRRLGLREGMIVAGHSLVEAYSVLTRLPQPNRIPSRLAAEMVRASFVEGVPVITLDAPTYLGFLAELAEQGIAGGSVYDAVIAAC